MKELFKFNIQLFAEGGEPTGGGGAPTGEPTPGGEGTTTPPAGEGAGTGGTFEVPEYLNSYVEGLQDVGQKEYLQGLLADEKAVNLLKGLIQDPNAEYTIKADDYKDFPDDLQTFLAESKKLGVPENVVKMQIEARKNYIESNRARMTPEQIALDPIINNFIGAEQDAGIKEVYARLAENADGRRVLQKLMELSNPATTSVTGGYAGGTAETYDYKSFIDAYNEAKPVNGKEDKNKLRALENFARNNRDPYFKDFLGIK